MKCFKHFDTDAVCASEIYVGRNASGEIREIRPVCQDCLVAEQKRIDEWRRGDKKLLIGFFIFFAIFLFFMLR